MRACTLEEANYWVKQEIGRQAGEWNQKACKGIGAVPPANHIRMIAQYARVSKLLETLLEPRNRMGDRNSVYEDLRAELIRYEDIQRSAEDDTELGAADTAVRVLKYLMDVYTEMDRLLDKTDG